MAELSTKRRYSSGSTVSSGRPRRLSVPTSSALSSSKSDEGRTAVRGSDVALTDREKQHYDNLRRRISDFVGHNAYEENTKAGFGVGEGDSIGDESKPDNFAQNYLKAKKQLSEGSHDRMFKWMGFSSEEEMQQKTGNKLAKPLDETPARKNSGGSVPSAGKSGGSILGPPGGAAGNDTRRRRSSTETAPRKLSDT